MAFLRSPRGRSPGTRQLALCIATALSFSGLLAQDRPDHPFSSQDGSPIPIELPQRQTPRPAPPLTQRTPVNSPAILSDGLNWTMVPRAAILHLPDDHVARVGTKPVGNLLPWADFLDLNSAWITAERVSLRQAEGLQQFNRSRISYLKKQPYVVIATYRGEPISVTRPCPTDNRVTAQHER